MNQKQDKGNVVHNIHDTHFKHNFRNKKVAKDFLLHHLSKVILDIVDTNSLEVEPNEFIPSHYRVTRNADIVYSLKAKKETKIYAILDVEGKGSMKTTWGCVCGNISQLLVEPKAEKVV